VTVLDPAAREFLAGAQSVVLVTIAPDGRPRPVPACLALTGWEPPIAYSPIDDKPKATDDPYSLARVRDIRRDPRVALLASRWDEDWSKLAWLRCEGRAAVLDPAGQAPGANARGDTPVEHAAAVAALRAKYPQYLAHRLEARPILRIELERAVLWGDPAR